eukprot:scaffold23107_cov159-Isochrysis_galbana.AAC.1
MDRRRAACCDCFEDNVILTDKWCGELAVFLFVLSCFGICLRRQGERRLVLLVEQNGPVSSRTLHA